MKLSRITLATASGLGLALSLAACDNEAEDVEPVAVETEAVIVDFDPMTREYVLTGEQRVARDSYDMDAMQEEYAGYRDEIEGAAATGGGMAEGDAAGGSSEGGSAGGALPDRSEMDWAYLDRNDDGQLSVAEYAIWAVPVDPTEPKANDENKPYLSSDQANKAADSFFYYDRDGNTYLSEAEFAAARRGQDYG